MQGPLPTPTKFFLVEGHSEGMTPLNAFDSALLDAKIGNTNLVRMSSILPPGAEKIRPVKIPEGSLLPVAYASKVSGILGEMVASAVAVAIPKDPAKPGLIMEYSATGYQKEIEEIVRNMAQEGMRYRNCGLKEVQSISVQHKVKNHGATFAACVLWW